MAITNFIPQVWSARLQENLHNALVFGTLCNRNYEGDIAQWGDTVHINALNDITVRVYDPTREQCNHGAYYNFFINDVDAAQTNADLMDAAMRNAAYQLASDAELYILQTIRSESAVKNSVSMPTVENGKLYELLLDIKTSFDTAGVPRHDRKLIIPPSLESMLLMDNRFITGSAAAATNLAEGSIARAVGFDIYVSNELDDEIVAMIPDAVTFANQITKVEAYRPEKGFCDGLKGLCLSGAKVLIPNAVAVFTLTSV